MPVYTAALGIIKVNGIAIGTMKTINITEDYRTEQIYGIGNFEPQELATLQFSGTATAEMYNVDFYKALNVLETGDALLRTVDSIEQFADTILLNTDGVDIDLYRKVEASRSANGAITSTDELFASLRGAKITKDGMSLTEGQVSGRNVEFMYRSGISRLA